MARPSRSIPPKNAETPASLYDEQVLFFNAVAHALRAPLLKAEQVTIKSNQH
jgi:hypothetical protein